MKHFITPMSLHPQKGMTEEVSTLLMMSVMAALLIPSEEVKERTELVADGVANLAADTIAYTSAHLLDVWNSAVSEDDEDEITKADILFRAIATFVKRYEYEEQGEAVN